MNTIPEDTTYRVVSWDSKAVLSTHTKLSTAKKDCRSLGYIESRFEGKIPIAFVQCDIIIDDIRYTDCCIYNPRF